MNYIFGWQFTGCCDHCLPGRQALGIGCLSDLLTLLQYLRPAAAMNSTIDSAASQQCRVSGVYYSVHILSGDIANEYKYPSIQKYLTRGRQHNSYSSPRRSGVYAP